MPPPNHAGITHPRRKARRKYRSRVHDGVRLPIQYVRKLPRVITSAQWMQLTRTYTDSLTHHTRRNRDLSPIESAKLMFGKKDSFKDGDISVFFSKHLFSMSSSDIASFIYLSSIVQWRLSYYHICTLLGRILHLRTQSECLHMGHIGMIMLSLRATTAHDIEAVKVLLFTLSSELSSSHENITVKNLLDCLQGLQNISSDHEEVRMFLRALVPKIASCSVPLRGPWLGSALRGMRNLNSDHEEVQELLTALADNFDAYGMHLDHPALCKSLYGMRAMSPDQPTVRRLMRFFISELETYAADIPEELKPSAASHVFKALCCLSRAQIDDDQQQEVLKAMLSVLTRLAHASNGTVGWSIFTDGIKALHGLNCNNLESRQFISTLVPIVERMQEGPLPVHVGNTLTTFSNHSSQSEEICQLLSALACQFNKCTEGLHGKNTCNAIHGLQNMSSDATAVRDMISVLTRLIEVGSHRRTRGIDGKGVQFILTGVRGFDCEVPEVQDLLKVLSVTIGTCTETIDPVDLHNTLRDMHPSFLGSRNQYVAEFIRTLYSICHSQAHGIVR